MTKDLHAFMGCCGRDLYAVVDIMNLFVLFIVSQESINKCKLSLITYQKNSSKLHKKKINIFNVVYIIHF